MNIIYYPLFGYLKKYMIYSFYNKHLYLYNKYNKCIDYFIINIIYNIFFFKLFNNLFCIWQWIIMINSFNENFFCSYCSYVIIY